MTVQVHGGLFNRVLGVFETLEGIRRIPSDEEAEGLLRVLPPEVSNNLSPFFEPHVRAAGVPFLHSLMRWLYRIRDAKDEGRKVILVPFNFPPDLVMAFDGAEPMTSEVMTTLAAVGLQGGGERYWDLMMSLGLPDHICSSNSVEIGSVLSGEDLVPDAIISAAPGGCDANSKIHEFLSNYLDIPQFLLEKPVDDSPEGRAQFAVYYRKLIADLEGYLGERLDEHRLRALLTGANRCTELYWELYELHKARPCPVPNIFALFLAPLRFCSWGTPEAIEVLEGMVAVSRARLERGAYPADRERARILWAYTSYYFDLTGLHSWMERRGYTFLFDVLDLYMPQPIDLSSMDTMIDGLIATTWDYPMNRQMAAPSMSHAWTRDVAHTARELEADCVIYCGHDACKQTWSVVSILREQLMKQSGIPLLILHGDSWMKTTTPITAIQKDIDEFVNGVVLRKRRGRRRLRKRPASRAE
jgi:benzoyl-CoA reductase/2-hydroxyglutaryl-CoA dehydratase subunit BcrC/BadD/HgdB